MECKFCGAKIDDKDLVCEKCGESTNRITSSEENLKLIDEMPELHDELDKLGEIKEVSGSVKKRVIIAVILVVLCLCASLGGMIYIKNKKAKEEAMANAEPKISAVSGEFVSVLEGEGFSDATVTDEASAKALIDSVKSKFNITDERIQFKLERKIQIGGDTYYRFSQYCGSIKVYGGEIVLMAGSDKTPKALNGKVCETDGLDTVYSFKETDVTNAINSYTGKIMDEYSVAEGGKLTEPEKTIVNFEGKTYLAYYSNMSGYNENGEYVAYDVFIDGDAGNGICIFDTASYENADDIGEEQLSPVPFSVYTVNDKFNWNDDTKTSAKDIINSADIDAGLTSAYVTSVKSAVDKVYKYFEDRFSWRGLDGAGSEFKVYINPNEYVEDKLPPDKALYSNGVMMFVEEDMISASLDINTAAHEYAHGVVENISKLDGTRALTEGSAIAEGIADVFGELAEGYYKDDKTPDWLHGERNMAEPQMGYLSSVSDEVMINSLSGCYNNSTIVSHAYYRMWAEGMPINKLDELLFRSVALMTGKTDFSEWRSITEYNAYSMMREGKISEEEFAAVIKALENTQITSKKLYDYVVPTEPDELADATTTYITE